MNCLHVGKLSSEAKYWLNPVALSKSRGFREHELNEIQKILAEYRGEILEAGRREEVKRGQRES